MYEEEERRDNGGVSQSVFFKREFIQFLSRVLIFRSFFLDGSINVFHLKAEPGFNGLYKRIKRNDVPIPKFLSVLIPMPFLIFFVNPMPIRYYFLFLFAYQT